MDLTLTNEQIGLVVTTTGGCVWRFFVRQGEAETPVFREPPPGDARVPLTAACFPMVPFGNRVRGNRFTLDGRSFHLTANMPWDQYYMHGDGWTSEWACVERTAASITLRMTHQGGGTPYAYEAEQRFGLEGPALRIALSVTNRGEVALPFGLGLHPYFPLTASTTLTARTRSYWEQDTDLLPISEHPTSGDLDFSSRALVPRRWVNAGFEDWDGRAEVRWPERRLALDIAADALFDRCVLFVSDPAYDPTYSYDSFCFEPMSHSIDAHNHPDGAGLVRLAAGERLSGGVTFTVKQMSD